MHAALEDGDDREANISHIPTHYQQREVKKENKWKWHSHNKYHIRKRNLSLRKIALHMNQTSLTPILLEIILIARVPTPIQIVPSSDIAFRPESNLDCPAQRHDQRPGECVQWTDDRDEVVP